MFLLNILYLFLVLHSITVVNMICLTLTNIHKIFPYIESEGISLAGNSSSGENGQHAE